MHLEALLDAIDEYINIKKRAGAEATAPCYDWDCGLASDLISAYTSPEHARELDRAKAALEAALEGYIDSRIDAILKERGLL
jgi:hypothetical protein